MKGPVGPSEAIACAVRKRLHKTQSNTNAYRIINGQADQGPPGLTIDRYDRWLVVGARAALPRTVVDRWVVGAYETLQPEGIVLKVIEPEAVRSRSEVIYGPASPPPILVFEGDARLECQLHDGVQTGLFLDQRHTRQYARQFAKGVEVLNLFAYTGSFTVHTALAGARRVTSVDVSQKALQWGRRNMRHSGLNPDEHRWFNDDALDHLRRPRRSYGLVVLDPPVFGHGKKPFALQQDLDTLIRGAINQLTDDSVLILSTHHLDLRHEHLEQAIQQQVIQLGGSVSILDRLGLPLWDHPTLESTIDQDPDDRGQYLHTVVAQIHHCS